MLTWSEVAGRLAAPRNYWICVVDRDGSPHVSPVWGAVVGEVLHFYTEDGTAKARNLARDPRVAVHLESGDDVVIVRGVVEPLGRPRGHADIVAAFAAKYRDPDDLQYLPAESDVLNAFYALRPSSALLWQLATIDVQRRWTAGATTSDASS